MSYHPCRRYCSVAWATVAVAAARAVPPELVVRGAPPHRPAVAVILRLGCLRFALDNLKETTTLVYMFNVYVFISESSLREGERDRERPVSTWEVFLVEFSEPVSRANPWSCEVLPLAPRESVMQRWVCEIACKMREARPSYQ